MDSCRIHFNILLDITVWGDTLQFPGAPFLFIMPGYLIYAFLESRHWGLCFNPHRSLTCYWVPCIKPSLVVGNNSWFLFSFGFLPSLFLLRQMKLRELFFFFLKDNRGAELFGKSCLFIYSQLYSLPGWYFPCSFSTEEWKNILQIE